MASEAEGFICPYCLVTFANPSKLQTHFVEMHSGQGQVDDLEAIDNGSSDNGEDVSGLGYLASHMNMSGTVRSSIIITRYQKAGGGSAYALISEAMSRYVACMLWSLDWKVLWGPQQLLLAA